MASILARIWSRLCPKRRPLSIMMVGLDNSGKTSLLNCLASSSPGRAPSLGSRSQSAGVSASNEAPAGELHQEYSDEDYRHDQDDGNNGSGPLIRDHTTSFTDINNNNRPGRTNDGNILPTVGYNYERLQYKSLTMTVLDFSGQNKYRGLWQEFYNCVDGIVFVIDSSDLIRLVVVRDELENLISHPYFSSLPRAAPADNKTTDEASRRAGPAAAASDHSPAIVYDNIQQRANDAQHSVQKQLTISQGKLVQTPLESANSQQTARGPPLVASGNVKLGPGGQTGPASCPGGRRTKVPILFLANKADLANSVSTEVIIRALNLNQLPSDRHPWFIQAASVNSCQGIADAFDWLVDQLTKTQ